MFEIKGGFYNKEPPREKNGKIPFLGAIDNSNGIAEFYSYENILNNSKTGDSNNESIDKKIFKGNSICVTNNGSVGHAYYQKHRFTCSHDVNPLYLKKIELNSILAKFIITAIEKQRVCFRYIHKWRPSRMKKSKILLPVTSTGEIDYEFMESYIQKLENVKLDEYKKYAKKRINEILFSQKVESVKLEEKNWKVFFISGDEGVFRIKSTSSGIDKNKLNLQPGKIPYITRSDASNGINLFLTERQQTKYKIDSGNCITIGLDTQTVFYQPYNFYTGQNIQVLTYDNCGKENALFILKLIQLQLAKFNWGGNGATLGRLSGTKILLPATPSGEPDYLFMENYIRKIMLEKYSEYLAFKKEPVYSINPNTGSLIAADSLQ